MSTRAVLTCRSSANRDLSLSERKTTRLYPKDRTQATKKATPYSHRPLDGNAVAHNDELLASLPQIIGIVPSTFFLPMKP
jgi:hypothetical protein